VGGVPQGVVKGSLRGKRDNLKNGNTALATNGLSLPKVGENVKLPDTRENTLKEGETKDNLQGTNRGKG